jgi:hypothetical protein
VEILDTSQESFSDPKLPQPDMLDNKKACAWQAVLVKLTTIIAV